MSVEQIIDQLRIARSDNSLSEEVYSKTVAALKAGQVMRVSREGTKTHDKACEAWDEATREEVCKEEFLK
jgi:hypothetical protein